MLFATLRLEIAKQYTTIPPAVGSAIEGMESDIERLLQSWSIMAGRNLMSDIMRKAGALEPLLDGHSKNQMIRFKTELAKQLEKHNPSKARYDSVLCLGYRAKTSTGAFEGKPNDYADMKDKCDDMVDAIKKAHGSVSQKHKDDGRMLKIFMAPEFFFRGAEGGYDMADVTGLEKTSSAPARDGLIDIIRKEIDKDIYKDWLFVLGTVIALSKETKFSCKQGCKDSVKFEKQPDGKTTKPVCKVDKNHVIDESWGTAAVDNVAYIVKEQYVHTVSKELVSHIDFSNSKNKDDLVGVRKEGMMVSRYATPSGYTAAEEQKPDRITDERMGGCIFTMDGITFSCEVCLDHVASTGDGRKGRGSDHAGDIQVQLIPSAGMWVSQFKTVPKGVVFNVDGSTPHVQVVGVSTANSKVVQAIQTFPGVRQIHNHATWDEKAMAAELDMYHKGYQSPEWQNRADISIGAAKRGSVLQFGPFEIPAL